MTWPAFIVALVQSLAWPLTTLTIFLFLRKKVADLIPLLRELKYKDIHLTFGEQVRELAAELSDSLPVVPAAPLLPEGESSHLDSLARLSPRAAIIESWIPVEHAALSLAAKRGIVLGRDARISGRGVMEALQKTGVVSEEETHLFQALRSLRNQAAHASELTDSRDAVTEYIELAQRLTAALNVRQAAA